MDCFYNVFDGASLPLLLSLYGKEQLGHLAKHLLFGFIENEMKIMHQINHNSSPGFTDKA